MVKLSVVIPTYNRRQSLARVLAGLAQQDLPWGDFEVIVVCDGSADDTPAWLAALRTPFRLCVENQANQGPGAARNRGVSRALADLVVFLDDDVVPDPACLSEHLRAHAQHGSHAIVLGPMLPPPDHIMPPWVRWSHDRLLEQYHAMTTGAWAPTARQFYTGNCSLARRHLLACGGFDERFRRAEDVELAYRLAGQGLQFYFHPAAAGYHYEIRSFTAWLAIPYHYGQVDVALTRDKGQTWLLPTVLAEFHERSWVVRAIVRLCLGYPARRSAATHLLHRLAVWAQRLGLGALVRLACSSLFNLYHYQGIADSLGSRSRFYAMAAGAAAQQTRS